MPFISIIIPVYNSENYIAECIQSIVKQTFLNWELIIVDDGSTDTSLKICRQYASEDKRIVVYSQENRGQASARNSGVDKARGNYIAFVDSDDTVSLDIFDENLKIMESDSSIDILQFPVYRAYGSNRANLRKQKIEYIRSRDSLFQKWIENNTISWIVCDKIFKRELFSTLRFREGMVYEDNYLIAEILSNIKCLFVSEKGIYYYHARENSTTTSPHSLQKELDTQKVSLAILAKLILFSKNSNLKIIILNRIFNVYQSLYRNYKYTGKLDPNFTTEFNSITLLSILKSRIALNQRIKLCLIKVIGAKNYLKFYNL